MRQPKMRPTLRFTICIAVVLLMPVFVTEGIAGSQKPVIKIGSKAFAESYILAEMAAQLLLSHGYRVERKHGLGGTLIVYQALLENEIDMYPEYTGTLTQAILKDPDISLERLPDALAQQNLQLIARFGFNNSYAIAMSKVQAQLKSIRTISDLREHPDLLLGFSPEFRQREDGWQALKRHYQLTHNVKSVEHALAYQAIQSKKLAATDAYTTDGDIERFELQLLLDDKQFFPTYYAALLARRDLPADIVEQLNRLSGSIDEKTMQALNRRISQYGEKAEDIATDFLLQQGLIKAPAAVTHTASDQVGGTILNNTLTHLTLTAVALSLACLFAIPLSLLLSQYPATARIVIYITGLVQTIPSLALLALMIPLFGLGQLPAIIALFLYSLLPIIRNTLTGLFTVDPLLKQVATGIGLTPSQQIWRIELPLALPQLIAGVKTAAIISIGTATLAAFVGAGGLGEPIITGLTLNDHQLILKGAIPAALLAIITEFVFEAIERLYTPKHLLKQSQ